MGDSGVMETLAVDQVISDRLKGSSALQTAVGGTVRLHADLAPEKEAATIWLVFELADAADTNAMGGRHVMARPMYNVKVCGRDTGYQALKDACNAVHAALTAGRVLKDGVWVGNFIRTNTVRGIDEIKNVRVYWIGQIFDLRANPN